jgi:uncharacterized protein YdcH (DUF465 family)
MDPIEVARMIDAHIAELLAERNKLRDTLKEIADDQPEGVERCY